MLGVVLRPAHLRALPQRPRLRFLKEIAKQSTLRCSVAVCPIISEHDLWALSKPRTGSPFLPFHVFKLSSVPPMDQSRFIHTDEKQKIVVKVSDHSEKRSLSEEAGSNVKPRIEESYAELLESFFAQLRSVPNIITTTRMMCTPVLSYFLLTEQFHIAMYGCAAAAFSDWLDGYIAKKYPSQSTVLGTYLDPLADKILINVLGLSLWHISILPAPLVFLWLTRDLGLIVGTYQMASQMKRPGDALFDPSRTALKVEPTTVGKLNTVLQFGTIAMGISQPVFEFSPDLLFGLCWVTGATTIGSALSYLGGRSMTASGNRVRFPLVKGPTRSKQNAGN